MAVARLNPSLRQTFASRLRRLSGRVPRDGVSPQPGQSFHFGKLREAHAMMDENRASWKIVIELD
jgi:hypothetical protein